MYIKYIKNIKAPFRTGSIALYLSYRPQVSMGYLTNKEA